MGRATSWSRSWDADQGQRTARRDALWQAGRSGRGSDRHAIVSGNSPIAAKNAAPMAEGNERSTLRACPRRLRHPAVDECAPAGPRTPGGLVVRPAQAPVGRALPTELIACGRRQLKMASATVRRVEQDMLANLDASEQDQTVTGRGSAVACQRVRVGASSGLVGERPRSALGVGAQEPMVPAAIAPDRWASAYSPLTGLYGAGCGAATGSPTTGHTTTATAPTTSPSAPPARNRRLSRPRPRTPSLASPAVLRRVTPVPSESSKDFSNP